MENNLLKKYHDKSVMALEEFLKENFEECIEEKEMCPTTWKSHYIIKDMMESICYSSKLVKNLKKSNWNKALETDNIKWLLYMRLADDIKDASMDIELMRKAKQLNNTQVVTAMLAQATQRSKDAEAINALYITIPYNNGSQDERIKWDTEYAETIEKHKKNVLAINSLK